MKVKSFTTISIIKHKTNLDFSVKKKLTSNYYVLVNILQAFPILLGSVRNKSLARGREDRPLLDYLAVSGYLIHIRFASYINVFILVANTITVLILCHKSFFIFH